jgi:hypothetical protein
VTHASAGGAGGLITGGRPFSSPVIWTQLKSLVTATTNRPRVR